MIKPNPVSSSMLIPHYQTQRPIEWNHQFSFKRPLEVEIGCGLGEFLTLRAGQARNKNFIGIELDFKRVEKTLRRIAFANLQNVRVMNLEAGVVFERFLMPSSVDHVYCLFPCPWPKRKHEKNRLFDNAFLRLVNSRLVQQGELKIVTDDARYMEWIFSQIPGSGFTVSFKKTAPQYGTKFERKWIEEGKVKFFELRLLKERHMFVPLKEDVPLKKIFIKEFDPDRFDVVSRLKDPGVIVKDYLYDPKRQRAMLHLVVVEATLTQNVWVVIEKAQDAWAVYPARGATFFPTAAVRRAIALVGEAAQKCARRLEHVKVGS